MTGALETAVIGLIASNLSLVALLYMTRKPARRNNQQQAGPK